MLEDVTSNPEFEDTEEMVQCIYNLSKRIVRENGGGSLGEAQS